MHEESRASGPLQARFFRKLRHDLRSPIHTILRFSQLLAKDLPAPDSQRRLTHIYQAGEKALRQVDEIIDFVEVVRGDFQYSPAEFDVNRVVDEVQAAARTSAECVQVFRNLLSNAIKFSPDGSGIDVVTRLNGESISVTVSDRGVGVPEAELHAIFDKFVQSSKTRTGAGGTGLGLSICREIVSAHGGRIWAENRPDGGAMFTVVLPVHVEENRGTRDSRSREQPPPGVGSLLPQEAGHGAEQC